MTSESTPSKEVCMHDMDPKICQNCEERAEVAAPYKAEIERLQKFLRQKSEQINRLQDGIEKMQQGSSERAASEPAAPVSKERTQLLAELRDAQRGLRLDSDLLRAEIVGRAIHFLERAASEPLPEQWQSIETAPKDGTKILLGYFPEPAYEGASTAESCEVAFWHGIHKKWCGRVLLNADGVFSPTHWMPLPPYSGSTKGESR